MSGRQDLSSHFCAIHYEGWQRHLPWWDVVELFPVQRGHVMKVLLTSVCRPLGPEYGDSSSVGYELLYRQVTRAQGIFSPRTVNVHFSLEYIAENLDTPTVVLQYPSQR